MNIFSPNTKEELQKAIDLYYNDESNALEIYGSINTWDTSQITDMSYMFEEATSFNQDISNWNVSNVEDMCDMFSCAVVFNQNIGNWNVSNLEYAGRMFECAISFNQNLDNWNLSNIDYDTDMFNGSGMKTLPVWYVDC